MSASPGCLSNCFKDLENFQQGQRRGLEGNLARSFQPQPHGLTPVHRLDTEERRREIIKILQVATEPVTGTELSGRLDVSRQVIVQDMAVLRAAGEKIQASPQGYYLYRYNPGNHQVIVAVRHSPEQTEDELTALVDVGVEVVDVIVEHPIYGEQRGLLHISSREDVQQFIRRWQETGAHLLSELTDGVHLHTLEARRPEQLRRAQQVLRGRGYLVD